MENGFEIGEVLGIQSSLIRKTGVFKGGGGYNLTAVFAKPFSDQKGS